MTDNLTVMNDYMSFRGTMRITPSDPNYLPFEKFGNWLYQPNTDCWYCHGFTYAADTCEIVEMV